MLYYLNKLLSPMNLIVLKKRLFNAMLRETSLAFSLFNIHTAPETKNPAMHRTACVIFSMDRALQLHALLCSFYEKVANPAPIHILYRTTTAAHEKAYNDVFALFGKRCISTLRQETKESFKPHVLSLLTEIHSEKVFFLTDDDIFIDDVDLLDFSRSDTRTAVASLRMGEHLKRCYPVQKAQRLPEFISCGHSAPDKLCWIWASGEHDWNYPLSVNGHLLSTAEVRALAENTEFQSPNTFEANIQVFSKYYTHRLGVCYKRSKILNVPINKVQSDNDNVHGSVHQDLLLDQWNQGLQMDYRALYGMVNESAHQEVPITFIKRD